MLGEDIAERLVVLAVAVVRLTRTFPRDSTSRHVATQLVRAATSGGANYEEARRAESRADFIHKVSIAAKEVGEAVYWLRLCSRLSESPKPYARLIDESNELIAILVASARTARQKL